MFHCINTCRVPRMMLNTRPIGLVFKQHPRDPANVNAWKNMCDPYNTAMIYCQFDCLWISLFRISFTHHKHTNIQLPTKKKHFSWNQIWWYSCYVNINNLPYSDRYFNTCWQIEMLKDESQIIHDTCLIPMCTYNICPFNKWVSFTIKQGFHKLLNYFLCLSNKHVEMNRVLCSLACTWVKIIDSQFYIIIDS